MSASDGKADLKKNPVFLSAVFLTLWSVPWMIYGASTMVGGQRFFFLADDPTISMRYARNFARGFGLVWNPGDRLEGYSNFLWTVYMGALHLLPLSNATTALAVMISNVVIAIVGSVFVYKIARRLQPEPWFAWIVTLAYAMNGDLFEWMIRGFETSLMATTLLAAFYMVLVDTEEGKPRFGTHLVVISLSLIRTDGMAFSGLLMLWSIFGSKDRARAFLYCVVTMAVPLGHLYFRWRYYGDLLPNTAYLKVFGWGKRVLSGARWTARFYLTYSFGAVLVAAAFFKMKSAPVRFATIVCALFSLYVVYVGGDIFVGFRFLAPIVPLLLISAFAAAWHFGDDTLDAGAGAGVGRILGTGKGWIVVGFIVFCGAIFAWVPIASRHQVYGSADSLVAALAFGIVVLQTARLARRSPRFAKWVGWKTMNPTRLALVAALFASTPIALWTHIRPAPMSDSYPDNVAFGQFMHDHLPENAVVADTWAGLPFYFSERRGIDLLGKCDGHVAREPAASEGTLPGHNKFDYDYSLGVLKPDYVAAAFKLPVDEDVMRVASHGDTAFIGRLYFNETFRRACLPHPVAVPPGTLRTLFACEWPSAAK
jgi:hypothetical protein